MTHPDTIATTEPGSPPRTPTSPVRRLVDEPSTILMAVAVLILAFLVLYPVFWLFFGSFAYGNQTFSQVLRQFWAMPGLASAFTNTALMVAGTVLIAFLFALPLAWIT